MNVVTLKDIPNVPVEGAERIEGWTGPVSRSRQTIIQPGDSANYNCSVVNFSQGCTTGWHTHTCDQILVVTSGSGMVATEHEQRDQYRRRRAHQGRRTPLAWRQGQYDNGPHHDHRRGRSSHLGLEQIPTRLALSLRDAPCTTKQSRTSSAQRPEIASLSLAMTTGVRGRIFWRRLGQPCGDMVSAPGRRPGRRLGNRPCSS